MERRKLSNDVAFIDTGALIALFSARDEYHIQAKSILSDLRRQRVDLMNTSAIVFELLDDAALRDRRASKNLSLFVATFDVEVVHVDFELLHSGWKLYDARPDKNWSLTDCVSFALMTRRKINDAFAHDHHFEQAGFRALLRQN